MATVYDLTKLEYLTQALWTMLLGLIFSSVIFIFFYIFQKIRFRRKYNGLIPGLKLRFSDVVSGERYLHFYKKSRSGCSMQSLFLVLIAGTAKLFEDNKLFCTWFTWHPMVFALKGGAAEVMLKDPAMSDKNFMYKHLIPLLGEGLVTSSGDKWKCRRKMLNPCFHWDILKEYIPIFNEQANKLVKNLQKGTIGEVRELYKPISYCVLDIVCETIMGVKVGAQDNKNTQYVEALQGMEESVIVRILSWWMWPDFIFRYTETNRIFNDHLKITNVFTNQILQQKKKQYMSRGPVETAPKRRSLLELLLELHIDIQSISEEDIKEELNTFTAAANDTTAATLNFVLYFLGQYKDIQDKAQSEVDRIFRDDKERPVEKEDLNEMKYLECVIKETLRILPVVPVIFRTVSTDVTICGYNIPKGSSCAICPYVLHRDPETFPDPERFDPTRFFPENSAKRHPFSYVPFSGGPRNCIGQKFSMLVMKTVVSTILRYFSVESLDQRDTLDLLIDVTLKPSKPLNFRLKHRV